MARILVCEPDAEVRGLLEHVIGRLGHEAVFSNEDGGIAGAVDVLIVEPRDPRALATAQIVRLEHEGVSIVCASIFPPGAYTRLLHPVAYLVKPFALREFEAALVHAVARPKTLRSCKRITRSGDADRPNPPGSYDRCKQQDRGIPLPRKPDAAASPGSPGPP